jgi:hypothetical protein
LFKFGVQKATAATAAAAVEAVATTPLYAAPCTDGSHYVTSSATNAVAKVVKADTMPDGQKAVQFIAL